MVFDEAHQYLSGQRYRSNMRSIINFSTRAIQKIFLTASLAIRQHSQFLRDTSMPNSTIVIRAPCHQPQISYQILPVNPARIHLDNAVQVVMEQLESQGSFIGGPNRRQGIIFGTSTADIALVEPLVKGVVSQSNHPMRTQNEESWNKGKSQWIAATTTLVQGIDNSRVGAILTKVFHLKASLKRYHQLLTDAINLN